MLKNKFYLEDNVEDAISDNKDDKFSIEIMILHKYLMQRSMVP